MDNLLFYAVVVISYIAGRVIAEDSEYSYLLGWIFGVATYILFGRGPV